MNYRKLSFFAALCFFLSAVETAIPKPLPFIRLGLANLPVMLSLAYLNKKETSLLIILKVLLQGFAGGTLFSYVFVFSAAGSFASGFGMMGLYALCRKKISWIGISLWGGLLNNAAQLICAYFMMFGDGVKYIAPLMLCISFATTLILGIIANVYEEKSEWLRILDAPRGGAPASGSSEQSEGMSVSEGRKSGKAPIVLFVISMAGIIALSFIKNIFAVYGIFLAALIAVFFKKGKVRMLSSVIVICSITILSLFSPAGKILWQWKNFVITEGALKLGLVRSGKLCAMVFLSQLAVSGNLKLPGRAGMFIEQIFGTAGRLTKEKLQFRKKGFLQTVDQRILEVWQGEE